MLGVDGTTSLKRLRSTTISSKRQVLAIIFRVPSPSVSQLNRAFEVDQIVIFHKSFMQIRFPVSNIYSRI
jgi:hypothetical protein